MGRSGHLAPVTHLRGADALAREQLPREAASVGSVRLIVEEVLSRHDVDRSVVEAAVLLASELATDGVRHGTGASLVVEVALGSDRVQVTVTTDADRRPGEAAAPVAEHSHQVLDIMAAAWEVRTGGGARTGWCRLDRHPPGPGRGPRPGPEDGTGPGDDHGAPPAPLDRGERPALRRVK